MEVNNLKKWLENRKVKKKLSGASFRLYKANQKLIHILEEEVNEYRKALTSLQVDHDELKQQLEFYKGKYEELCK